MAHPTGIDAERAIKQSSNQSTNQWRTRRASTRREPRRRWTCRPVKRSHQAINQQPSERAISQAMRQSAKQWAAIAHLALEPSRDQSSNQAIKPSSHQAIKPSSHQAIKQPIDRAPHSWCRASPRGRPRRPSRRLRPSAPG
eukprot:209042-Prymnesium_polylepis.1